MDGRDEFEPQSTQDNLKFVGIEMAVNLQRVSNAAHRPASQ